MKVKIYKFGFCLFLGFNLHAQSYYGGIEIGDKEIKMTVIEVQNPKKRVYELKASWTENIEMAAGIPIECMFTQTDVDNIAQVILSNYKKMQATYNIKNSNIYIVAPSSVDMANNANFLIKKVKAYTSKNLEIISPSSEASLFIKGCIPQKNYFDSVVLDIGLKNTKGGYLSKTDDGNTSYQLTSDIGILTLTEKINHILKHNQLYNFNETIFNYLPKLREDLSKMYLNSPQCQTKINIYLSGEAVWAFYTLINEKEAPDNYNEIKYTDILSSKFVVENNFNKIKTAALTNKDLKKVLESYSQKNLIAAGDLLLTALEEIQDTDKKKVFFAKHGQISWLLSYISNRAM
ncbi:exopolyphosphatase [Flavobacterium sp. T12S277]|uniref:Ppx/GppA phosphatase family protein n=1 Tax=Flavobacterium sp. T12S277 TaxID=3402752 RepID=UPI003AEE570E